MTAVHWAFRSPLELPPDEAERWWKECFLSIGWPDVQRMWVLLLADPGCGKSVLLAERLRSEKETFFISYPTAHWPGQRWAWHREAHHIPQIMVAAGRALQHYFQEHPEQASGLDPFHREFIRWLLEKYQGERAFERFAMSLGEEWREIPFRDLYPSFEASLDVAGQIDELISVAQALGFKCVKLWSDINAREMAIGSLGKSLQQLLSEVILSVDHPAFGGYLALPLRAEDSRLLVERSHGRVHPISLQWGEDDIHRLLQRILSAAGGQDMPPDSLAGEDVWQRFREHLNRHHFISTSPRAWVGFIETLYTFMAENGGQAVRGDQFEEVLYRFYRRHVPLYVHRETEQVWRGDHPVSLTPQLRELLMVLVDQGGRPIATDNAHLLARLDLGNVPEQSAVQNVHTLVSCLRCILEPSLPRPVYVLNRRGAGYWLENVEVIP